MGSILVIISGFIPFIDNIITWIYPAFNKMLDARGVPLRSDIWIESIYASIILVSIGGVMQAYKLSYFFPIYAATYSLVMYELMRYGFEINPDWYHRLGFLFMLVPGFYIIYRLIEHIKDLKLQDEMQYNTIKRLSKLNKIKDEAN
ncbi:hypothetical protein MKJ01_05400 [Chryseobacterium sp. SSA4.19]|uniref:hypothetical protein n=1 Tax=Chryseobacterium sp. SSA4.19 TaxID=2919915 RepID=UPI001F4DBD2C|nr:hypothetical protein [Chryseobacterium sp. SSA4.19]MCJ8153196.1 hypothetical protein [Chryseobacterium sp. SSA4.19]